MFLMGLSTSNTTLKGQSFKKEKERFEPLSFEQADNKADSVLTLMSLDE